MKAKIVSMFLVMASSTAASSICEDELRRYKKLHSQAADLGIASCLSMGAGSFLGGLGGCVAGGSVGVLAARYNQMAEDALQDYNDCIARTVREARERMEAAKRAEDRRLEEEIRKQKEKLANLDI